MLDRDTAIFMLLKKNPNLKSIPWTRCRPTLQTLRHRFPLTIVNKKAKIVLLLKRHEHIWLIMLKLLGWDIVKRHETPLRDLEENMREVTKALKPLEPHLKNLPQWLKQTIEVQPYTKIQRFLDNIKRRYKEYVELAHKKEARMAALTLIGTNREEQFKKINMILHELLIKGITPLDYSYNSIIVPLDTSHPDPLRILKGFTSKYVIVKEIQNLDFEERDVGWGLKPKE